MLWCLAIAPLFNVNRTFFSFFCLFVNKNCIVFCRCPNFSGVIQPRSDVNISRSGSAKVVTICLA